MHFWTGVSMLAGACRRRVWFDQGNFKWYPNFFIVFVAPPGVVKKTTTINIGFDLLRHLKDVKFAPDSATWQHLYKFLAGCEETLTVPAPNGGIGKMVQSAATAFIGELETFMRLEDEGFNGAMIALYDGKPMDIPLTHGTVSSTNASIVNPWLNLLAATTPSWIRTNVPEAMISGGLFSRIVFVCAEEPRSFIAYPKYHQRPDHTKLKDALIHDLRIIGSMYGELTPTLELLAWGQKWYEEQGTRRATAIASNRYDGYYSRKQSHVHKLAMMMHISRSSTMELELRDVQAALYMIDAAEKGLATVFESIGMVQEARQANELISYVKAHKRLTSEQLWIFVRSIMTEKEFQLACKNAIDTKLLIGVYHNGKPYWELPPP